MPLFKYEDVETGVKIDVSFNVANGPAVGDALSLFPPPPPSSSCFLARIKAQAAKGKQPPIGSGRRATPQGASAFGDT